MLKSGKLVAAAALAVACVACSTTARRATSKYSQKLVILGFDGMDPHLLQQWMAEGKLPNSEAHLEVLTNLVYRWTPESLQDEPLPVKLGEIQRTTREYFRRLFG